MADKTENTKELIRIIKLTDLVKSPFQARFEEMAGKDEKTGETGKRLAELIRSIEQSGLVQPIIVRPSGSKYEIIGGHRRVEAMRSLGRGQIKAIVKDCTEREAQVMHVVGNLQRKNLNLIELAVTYQKLLETGVFKDKRDLSTALGKDETYIGDLLNTLKLDQRIIDDIAKNERIKDLRVLRSIRRNSSVDDTGKSDEQWELYNKVLREKLGRKEINKLVSRPKQKSLLKNWVISPTPRKIIIRLNTGKLPEEKQQELIRRLEEKLVDVSGSL